MRVLSALVVCVATAASLAGCSSHAAPAPTPPAPTPPAPAPPAPAPPAPAPEPAVTDTEQTPNARDAQLLEAITNSSLADKVIARAWTGDVMQVSVRSDRSTVRDQLRLCTELAGEFGDGYGIRQILVTVTPIETSASPATAVPLPEVRWSAKDRTCAPEPA